jgi:DNA/RNA endonuclease YhcR with UshA esterase domain
MRALVPALGLVPGLAFGFACGLTFAPASARADPITPASALAGPIAPADTPQHVGQSVTVEGVVSEVNTTDRAGVTFVDMGGHYPDNAFTAIIFKADAGKFPDVAALAGKTIDVTGTIKLYKGKTEIFVNDAAQIKLK